MSGQVALLVAQSGGTRVRALRAAADSFAADLPAGQRIATLSRPFGSRTSYSVVAPAPAALALEDGAIVRGAGAVTAGDRPTITIRATDGRGAARFATLGFSVTAPDAGTPEPTIDPAFADDFDSAGTMRGRAGWIGYGAGLGYLPDYTVAEGGVLRMTRVYNSEQAWFAPAQAVGAADRTIEFSYDFTQTGDGSANEDLGRPRKNFYQSYALGFDDPQNLLRLTLMSVPGGYRADLHSVVAGTERALGFFDHVLPAAATLSIQLRRGKALLSVDGVRVADALDLAGAPVGARTAIATNFYPFALAGHWRVTAQRIDLDDIAPFQPRVRALRGRAVALSGTCSGVPAALIYRVTAQAGGTVVQGWRALDGAEWADGAWRGSAFVPEGAQRIEVGFTDAAGITHVSAPVPIAVGVMVLWWGQSNALGRSAPAAGVDADDAPVDYGRDPHVYSFSGTYGWSGDGGPNRARLGRIAAFSRALSGAIGLPVAGAAAGVTGEFLHRLVPGAPAWDYFTGTLAAVGGSVEAVILDQGEADTLDNPGSRPAWSDSFAAFVAGARAATGDPALPLFLTLTGKVPGAALPTT